MMNDIIDRLSEIENAAVSIMNNSNAQKKELARSMEQQITELEASSTLHTQQTIDSMKSNMEKKISSEIELIRNESEKTLSSMEEEYNEHHAALAQDIFNKMTGV